MNQERNLRFEDEEIVNIIIKKLFIMGGKI